MTDEQIKALKAMRLDRIMRVQDKDRSQRIKEEGDALTAALEYIEDMRELEAAAVEVMFSNGRGVSRSLAGGQWFVWGLGSKTEYHDCLREAFKAVKGGKE